MASKFFVKTFITIPVAPVLTGTTVQFILHTRFVPIHKFLYPLLLLLLLLLLFVAFSNWTYFTSLLYIRASLLGNVCTVTVGTHVLV